MSALAPGPFSVDWDVNPTTTTSARTSTPEPHRARATESIKPVFNKLGSVTMTHNWKDLLPNCTPAEWPGKDAWTAIVDEWFDEHAVGRFAFLNASGLAEDTVEIMAMFSSATLTLVMCRCKGGGRGLSNNKVKSMSEFDERLYSALCERDDTGCYEPWESPM
jgi:hypothetical protein